MREWVVVVYPDSTAWAVPPRRLCGSRDADAAQRRRADYARLMDGAPKAASGSRSHDRPARTDESPAGHRDPVEETLAALERRDWERLKPLLHPYLRWTTSEGETLHGRETVMARLADRPAAAPPSAHELRDGQVSRWRESSACTGEGSPDGVWLRSQ